MLTADQVGEILGVPRRTIYAWVDQGVLPARRVGRRLLRFSMEDVLSSLPDATEEVQLPARPARVPAGRDDGGARRW